jgi:hypothetical protein
MKSWAKDESGMELLRPLAQKILRDPEFKKRVWSDHYEAWGFFGNRKEKIDDFLLWCSAKVGDRLALGSNSNVWMVGVILSIEKDPDPARLYWKMKLLNPNGKTLEFEIQEQLLFQVGWSVINA